MKTLADVDMMEEKLVGKTIRQMLPSYIIYYIHKRVIYIYNSVLTCRQHIINSSASAPPNATKIAVTKVSDVDVCTFGPEL